MYSLSLLGPSFETHSETLSPFAGLHATIDQLQIFVEGVHTLFQVEPLTTLLPAPEELL